MASITSCSSWATAPVLCVSLLSLPDPMWTTIDKYFLIKIYGECVFIIDSWLWQSMGTCGGERGRPSRRRAQWGWPVWSYWALGLALHFKVRPSQPKWNQESGFARVLDCWWTRGENHSKCFLKPESKLASKLAGFVYCELHYFVDKHLVKIFVYLIRFWNFTK